jgi:hypothetical protein
MTESEDAPTRVGHCKADEIDVYVGRGPNGRDMTSTEIGERGWLGNPHTLGEFSRGESIMLFRGDFVKRLREDIEFAAAVAELSGTTLGCWCQRLEEDEPACHGEVIAKYADRLSEEGPQTLCPDE